MSDQGTRFRTLAVEAFNCGLEVSLAYTAFIVNGERYGSSCLVAIRQEFYAGIGYHCTFGKGSV